eukprot:scaffold2351_cov233-Pinguiococcus_pyrenoidosus.AAC.3
MDSRLSCIRGACGSARVRTVGVAFAWRGVARRIGRQVEGKVSCVRCGRTAARTRRNAAGTHAEAPAGGSIVPPKIPSRLLRSLARSGRSPSDIIALTRLVASLLTKAWIPCRSVLLMRVSQAAEQPA